MSWTEVETAGVKPPRVPAAQGRQAGWALTMLQPLPLLTACSSQLQITAQGAGREGVVQLAHSELNF